MLEHADRDDAVEDPLEVAVVLQRKAHGIFQTQLARPGPRHAQLLARQRHAEHTGCAAHLLEIKPKPSPAAADVEHARIRLDLKLRRNQPLLGELGIIEALAGVFEISTAVLVVLVEEELVETMVQIVMVRDIAA